VPFKVYGNYFWTRYNDRIDTAANILQNFWTSYEFERELGPAVVQRNPSPARIAELSSSVNWLNLDVADVSTIGGVLDMRQRNLSVLRTSGMDFGGAVTFQIGGFEDEVGFDGTYIFDFESQGTAEALAVSTLNTPYNPIDLRVRLRNSLRRGPVEASVILNYSDGYYTNLRHEGAVASWSTIDLALAYNFEATSGVLHGLSAAFNVMNAADKDPPQIIPDAQGPAILRYDGTNANALGRFIAFQVRKLF
jgi:hypothetical protein